MNNSIDKLKAIIVIDNLYTGGIATSLYNFLHYSRTYFDIDILIFNEDLLDFSRIPEDVKIIKADKRLKILGLSQKETKAWSKFYAIKRFFCVLCSRIISGEFARKILFYPVKKIGTYDLAISFAQDNAWKSLSKGCIDFVVKKIEAKRKATFIHCDYSNYGGYSPKQERMLSKLDDVICVSESCKKSFSTKFPALETKCRVIENFTNTEQVLSMSTAYQTGFEKEQYFVSVCRLSEEKGLVRAINILGDLKRKEDIAYKWVIVGEGPERKNIEQAIKLNALENIICLVGNKNNPYPYIKYAKCLILVSFHEAAPMVFGESSILGVPIFSTETCSARELITQRGLGMVVKNSYDGIYNGFVNLFVENYFSDRMPPKDINATVNEELKRYYTQINEE